MEIKKFCWKILIIKNFIDDEGGLELKVSLSL